MLFDMPLDQLEKYTPHRDEPDDFDDFWEKTLQETRAIALEPKLKSVDYGLRLIDTYDVSYRGFGGNQINGWLLVPKNHPAPMPCVVEYIGYGGGRGFPIDWLLWSSVGYAHFIMDTRGQGSQGKISDTPDFEPVETSPHYPGFMTKGICSPDTYYYRRLYSDAVRAIDVVKNIAFIDPSKIAIAGYSQGGGIGLAAIALSKNISAALIDAPFLCHFRRATHITDELPYAEIARFCKTHRDKEQMVFNTLSYFDGVNFATRGRATALFSAGLMDMICPPSTVFAAYNHYGGEKQIKVWNFNEHEAGGSFQKLEQIRFLSNHWQLGISQRS